MVGCDRRAQCRRAKTDSHSINASCCLLPCRPFQSDLNKFPILTPTTLTSVIIYPSWSVQKNQTRIRFRQCLCRTIVLEAQRIVTVAFFNCIGIDYWLLQMPGQRKACQRGVLVWLAPRSSALPPLNHSDFRIQSTSATRRMIPPTQPRRADQTIARLLVHIAPYWPITATSLCPKIACFDLICI